jgi:hypothetical protein
MKTMDVFFFLVNQNHADLLPAWQHVDISVEGLRTLVAYVLGHTGVTLSDVYGDEIGPEQRFLVDLHAYLRTRDDWEEQEILATFAMTPTAEVDLQAVTTLCSSLLMTTVKFAYFFSSSLQTVKDGLVSSLQPLKFRDYIRKKFRNEYKLETMSLERLCSLIVSEADKDVAGCEPCGVAVEGFERLAVGLESGVDAEALELDDYLFGFLGCLGDTRCPAGSD